jgi:Ca2+-binding EF-hand superfamily protein
MDGNHDGHVCAIEFFGTLKIGSFFQTEGAMAKAAASKPAADAPGKKQPLAEEAPEKPFPITEFRKRMGAATPREAFRTLDENGDGRMSVQELLDSRTAFSPAVTQAQAKGVFKALDVQQDNGVSADEFLGPIARGSYSSQQAQPAEMQFDCDEGLSIWKKGWSEMKKTWCCSEEKAKCPKGYIDATDFKKRLGVASVHDAFYTLDANGDGFVDADELTASKDAFVPPISAEQAAYAAMGLDSDEDDKVGSKEFFTCLEEGSFFLNAGTVHNHTSHAQTTSVPHSDTTMPAEAPITMAEFQKRMGTATPQDALSMLDADSSGSMSLEELLGKAKAFVPPLTEGQATYVFKGLDADKNGLVGPTEFSGTLALGEFFQTPKAAAAAAAAVVRTTTMKPSGAGIADEAQPAGISLSDFKGRLGKASAQEAFDTLDTNIDGKLDIDELESASSAFVPPISNSAFEQILKKLDADGNEVVSAGEFVQRLDAVQAVKPKPYDCEAGLDNWAIGWSQEKKKWCCEGSNVGCEVDGAAAPAQLSLVDFVKRMRSSFTSPPDAFGAMDTDQDTLLSLNEFLVGSEHLQLPLTTREALYAFQGFDANSDNKVGAQEFYTALRKGHFSRADVGALPSEIGGSEAKEHQHPHAAHVGTSPSAVSTPPILLDTFAKRLEIAFSSPEDGWHALDKDGDGAVSREELVGGGRNLPSPLTEAEAKYAFDGFDVDHDNQVGLREFLGTLKIGSFFQSQEALDQALPKTTTSAPGEAPMTTQAPPVENAPVPVTTPVNMSAPQNVPAKKGVRNAAGNRLVSAADLQRYEGVPVIVSGTAEIAFGIAPSSAGELPEDSKEIGPLFGEALGEEMGVRVHVASAEDMPNNKHHGYRRSLVMWTADADDGGTIEGKLLDEAEEVEERVQKHIKGNLKWLQGGWVMVWSQATFNYYGPAASRLPQGQKLTQELGKKPGAVLQ